MKGIFAGDFKVTQPYHAGHLGMDLVSLGDKSIRSPVAGVVKTSTIITDKNNLTWEWGNYVRVDDRQGNRHFFCHLASRAVKAGDRVEVGSRLGVMGNTGKSYGAHCHYQVRDKWGREVMPHTVLGIPNRAAVYRWEKRGGNWYYGALADTWALLGSRWYYFDGSGAAVRGCRKIQGQIYCFAPRSDGDIRECQLLRTDAEGVLQ